MKRSILMISLLLAALFAAADTPAATRSSRYYRQPAREADNDYEPAEETRRRPRPTSRITRPQFLGDANSVTAKVNEFEGLGEALNKIGTAGEQESREWMRGAIEERIRLAEVVQKQMVEELALIRELAVKDEAEQTVAAIDAVMLERDERYRAMVTKMEERLRRMRAGERGRADPRTSRRGARSRYRDEGRYSDRYNQRYGERNGYREQNRYYQEQRSYPERQRYEEDYRYTHRYGKRARDEQPEDEEQPEEQDSKTKEQ